MVAKFYLVLLTSNYISKENGSGDIAISALYSVVEVGCSILLVV